MKINPYLPAIGFARLGGSLALSVLASSTAHAQDSDVKLEVNARPEIGIHFKRIVSPGGGDGYTLISPGMHYLENGVWKESPGHHTNALRGAGSSGSRHDGGTGLGG